MSVSLSFPSFSFFRPEVPSLTSGHPYAPKMGLSQSRTSLLPPFCDRPIFLPFSLKKRWIVQNQS